VLLPCQAIDPTEGVDEDEGSPEGRTAIRLHRYGERDGSPVSRKEKQRLAETGELECEVCSSDFEATFGDVGHAFAE
jgi:5-methylcytosine-specific restriction protein A